MFWIFLILIILNVFFYKRISSLVPKLKIGNFQVNEELANYFTTLDNHDRDFSIKEEENSRAVMGLQTLSEYTLDRLKTTSLGKQHM